MSAVLDFFFFCAPPVPAGIVVLMLLLVLVLVLVLLLLLGFVAPAIVVTALVVPCEKSTCNKALLNMRLSHEIVHFTPVCVNKLVQLHRTVFCVCASCLMLV